MDPNVHAYLSFTSCSTNGKFMWKWIMYSVTSLSACEKYICNFDAEVGRESIFKQRIRNKNC